jgi:hypothetical protein
MDEHHAEQVKSFLEHTHSISFMATATEVRISPASVYHILTSTAWGNKKFVQSGFHMCSMMTKQPCMFLPLPVYCIEEMKTMHF